MIEISKREEYYQQEYCGRVYSLRDTNMHSRSQGHEPIIIGQNYYRSSRTEKTAKKPNPCLRG